MKKTWTRKTLTMLLALCVAASFLSAACAESAGNGKLTFTEWKDRLLSVVSFKFQLHKDGIGFNDCPVYTAPYNDAFRFANYRQAVDTNVAIYEAGYCAEGWLMVRYDIYDGKQTRVGYIPKKYVSGFKSNMSVKNFDNISAVASGTIDVADNPLSNGTTFVTLRDGESFRILAKYTYNGNWWYIECTAEDGHPTRGFIDRDKSAFLPGDDVQDNLEQEPVTMDTIGTPSLSPDGLTQIGKIVVNGTANDERKRVRKKANASSDWVSVVYPTMTYPYYDVKEGKNGPTWYYIFVEPDSRWGWVAANLVTPVN